MRTSGVIAVLAVAAFFGCTSAHAVSSTPNPPEPRATAQQTSQPLPVIAGAATSIQGQAARPRADFALPDGRVVGSAADTLFISEIDRRGHAFDLTRGADRWTVSGVALSRARGFGSIAYLSVATPVVNNQFSSYVMSYDLRTGKQLHSFPGYTGAIVNGSLYVASRSGLTAYRLRDSHEMWSTSYQGTFQTDEISQRGNVLFVGSSGSGAISVTETVAIDLRTGHIRYTSGNGREQPLGFGSGSVYLDSTWPPDVLESYSPITIRTRDVESGKAIRSARYAPDPQRHGNGKSEPNAFKAMQATDVHVAGGYVYMTVDSDGYRYRADADPIAADLRRMPDMRVVAALAGGQLLVTTPDAVGLAKSYPDQLEVHPLGTGTLRKAVDAIDGRHLLVVGSRLLDLDEDGHVRVIGEVTCSNVLDIFAWNGGAAVECGTDHSMVGHRVLVYDDVVHVSAPPIPMLPTPAPTPVPAVRFSSVGVALPTPAPSTFPQQQDFGPIAPTRDGGAVVFTRLVGTVNPQTALVRIDAHGAARVIAVPPSDAPESPTTLLVDGQDRIWYNDRAQPTLIRSLSERDGVQRFELGGSPTPTPTLSSGGGGFPRMRRFGRGPLRITLGPDGEAWYARNTPTPEIGRVDGSVHFALPAQMGTADMLISDAHALWFAGTRGVGRMTTDGRFRFIAHPSLDPRRSFTGSAFTTGTRGTVWLADGGGLEQFDAAHLVRTVPLPNASDRAAAAATMCDGSLVVGEDGPVISRIDAHGAVNYATDGIGYFSQMVRGSDCRIWYVARNAPAGHEVGTLTSTAQK